MNARDLAREFLATPSLLKHQRQQLEGRGITQETVHRCGGLGWARVSTTGRLYQPADAGDVAIIQPVWAEQVPSIYQVVEDPLVDDLLAWRLEEPTHWYYRLGTPGAVLGVDNLGLAHSEGWPITFELTPLAWLLADCRGAVLLELCEAHWRAEDEAGEGGCTGAWWGGKAA